MPRLMHFGKNMLHAKTSVLAVLPRVPSNYSSASDWVVAIKSYLTPTLPCLHVDTNPFRLEILRAETQKQLSFKFWSL